MPITRILSNNVLGFSSFAEVTLNMNVKSEFKELIIELFPLNSMLNFKPVPPGSGLPKKKFNLFLPECSTLNSCQVT